MSSANPGRGTLREMDNVGPDAPTPHMAGPHRKDGRNLSRYWPGHCDCRPGEAELHARYLAYLEEAHRRGVEAVATGRHAEHYRWLDENDPYHVKRPA